MEAGISEKYGKLCRPRNIFWECLALAQSVEVKQLPVCYSELEEHQFMDVLSRAQKNITEQPCLKLTYDLKLQGPWSTNPNHTVFGVELTRPYETIVNEEYIIYDMVAMISAIGGTMGLCIGFSFKDCSRSILKTCVKVLAKIAQTRNKTNNDQKWEFLKLKTGNSGLKAQPACNIEDIGKSIASLRVEVTEQSRECVELRCKLAKYEERLDQLEKRQNNPLHV